MRRYVIPLLAANGIMFAAVGLSYILYSRLLTAEEFGIYSAALAVGTLATLVLDGGVKVSIIKHAREITRREEGALLAWMVGLAIVLLLVTLLGRGLVARFFPAAAAETSFVVAFTSVYLITYPWIGLPTAQMERRLAYSRLAWIESAGLVIERGLPAVFLLQTDLGLYGFVWSLALGRGVRIVALAWFHRVSFAGQWRESSRLAFQHVREGAWYQLGSGSALVRDNLHVLLIGPLFGAAWVGYYAWGLQLCVIASQVFVQISARISLPLTAQATDYETRWATIDHQVRVLTAATAPILAAALIVAPAADHQLFADKWSTAIQLLPLLFIRMLPGVASAPVGTMVLVERGARVYAAALWSWTVFELIAALAAIHFFGAMGLAASYSVAAWFGVWLFVRARFSRP